MHKCGEAFLPSPRPHGAYTLSPPRRPTPAHTFCAVGRNAQQKPPSLLPPPPERRDYQQVSPVTDPLPCSERAQPLMWDSPHLPLPGNMGTSCKVSLRKGPCPVPLSHASASRVPAPPHCRLPIGSDPCRRRSFIRAHSFEQVYTVVRACRSGDTKIHTLEITLTSSC